MGIKQLCRGVDAGAEGRHIGAMITVKKPRNLLEQARRHQRFVPLEVDDDILSLEP